MSTESKNNFAAAGRANTVLVFGTGDTAKAVISSVITQVRPQSNGKRIVFSGPVTFSEKTRHHIEDVVLKTADNILGTLKQPKRSFEISVANIGAASAHEIGLNISHYSADVSILLSILSAALQIAIPEDFVFTGHLASQDGDIRTVKDIPAKLESAAKVETINTFVYPDSEQDDSLKTLSPIEEQKISESVVKYKRDLQIIAVKDVSDLIPVVFSDKQVVESGLINEFYNLQVPPTSSKTPVIRAVEFFIQDTENRFWKILENLLLNGQSNHAERFLLDLFVFYKKKKTYPQNFGVQLLHLVQSLPPETRKLKINFPLVPISEGIYLSQFAEKTDTNDVPLLFKAINGDTFPRPFKEQKDNAVPIKTEPDKLQWIIDEISPVNLSHLFGIPVDSARASFVLDKVVSDSNEFFSETITSFYIHLLRHTSRISTPANQQAAQAAAVNLIEKSFGGGYTAALAEAKTATRGGMRIILDTMADYFKREQQEMYINLVFKTAVSPDDFNAKVEIVRNIIDPLKNKLPREITSMPPEQLAKHFEIIIKAYVDSLEQVNTVLRSI